MDEPWHASEIRRRFMEFPLDVAGLRISIKLRDASRGCMDGCCWPEAHSAIDQALERNKRRAEYQYKKHETGPEILSIVSDALSIAASTLAIVMVIIAAYAGKRSRHGKNADLELTVRGFDRNDRFFDEIVTKIDPRSLPTQAELEHAIIQAIRPSLEIVRPIEIVPPVVPPKTKPKKKDPAKAKATKKAAKKAKKRKKR